MSTVASDALKEAQMEAQKLSPPVANVSDAVTNAVDAISNHQELITSFMKKLGILVKVGDEVAKVCTSLSSALLHDLNRSFF
jgi:hypothetical protein